MATLLAKCCCTSFCDGNACEFCGAHTPNSFTFAPTGINFATVCQACTTSGSMKVLAATVNNITFPLNQDAGNACLWSYEDAGGHIDVAFYSSSDCTGTPTHADTLRINLRKTNATTFTVEVLAIGADDNVTLYTDTITVGANSCYDTLSSTNDQSAFSCPAQGAFYGGGVAGKNGTATIAPCAKVCADCLTSTDAASQCLTSYAVTMAGYPTATCNGATLNAINGTHTLTFDGVRGAWTMRDNANGFGIDLYCLSPDATTNLRWRITVWGTGPAPGSMVAQYQLESPYCCPPTDNYLFLEAVYCTGLDATTAVVS